MLHRYKPRKNLGSARKHYLDYPGAFLKIYGDWAFASAVPKLWNELPSSCLSFYRKQYTIDLLIICELILDEILTLCDTIKVHLSLRSNHYLSKIDEKLVLQFCPILFPISPRFFSLCPLIISLCKLYFPSLLFVHKFYLQFHFAYKSRWGLAIDTAAPVRPMSLPVIGWFDDILSLFMESF